MENSNGSGMFSKNNDLPLGKEDISLEDNNDIKLEDTSTSPISNDNENDSGNIEGFDLSATGLGQIDETSTQKKGEKISFAYKKKDKKIQKGPNYKSWSNFLNIVIVIFLLLAIGAGGYYLYIYYSNKENPSEKNIKYIETINNIKKTINDYIPISHNEKYIGLPLEGGAEQIINAKDLNYTDKKNLLHKKIKEVISKIAEEKRILENHKLDITKYAYLPKKIMDIIGGDDSINSIEDSLFSLEAIKFSSAVSVFIYLDSFIQSLSKEANMSSNTVKKNMEYINTKGDKNIKAYLKKCYLNPYETNYNCNVIGDYDRYIRIIDKDTPFKSNFFKEMIRYIDTRLERTELPSFTIIFQKFNKNSEKITFNIDINTIKQDEIELAKAGVLDDPVLFIMDKLINNLKKSRFIKGNNIKVDALKIKSKKVKVGITEFLVNTVSKSFELPIQKGAEREIYDFVEQ